MRIPSHAAFGMCLRHPAAFVCEGERVCVHAHVHTYACKCIGAYTCVQKFVCCLSVRTVCIEVCICTRIDAKVRVGEGLHQSEST